MGETVYDILIYYLLSTFYTYIPTLQTINIIIHIYLIIITYSVQ